MDSNLWLNESANFTVNQRVSQQHLLSTAPLHRVYITFLPAADDYMPADI